MSDSPPEPFTAHQSSSPLGISRRRSTSRKSLARSFSSGLDLSNGDVPKDPAAAQQAFFEAAADGDERMLRRLLEAGTPLNAVEPTQGDTALICAAMEGHTDIVKTLLMAGAWVNVANLQSETALHVAAWNGHKDIVAALLAAKADVNLHGPEGETPLLLAADGGHTEVAEMLLKAGAQPVACNDRGETPLQWAAWSGSVPLTALLLEHGADLHARDQYVCAGWTALLCACHQGHARTAAFLIRKGARTDVLDNFGRSGLWLAAAHGYTDCVRMLLRNGCRGLLDTPADAAPRETCGRTPLLIAAARGHTEVVRELLAIGPVLNAIDADGCGALHLAAQDGHADVVAALKEHGAVDGLPDLKGRSPADLARQHGHAAIARSLAEAAVRKDDVVPEGVWELVELALQAYNSSKGPSRAQLDSAIQRACKQSRSGTYLGSTLRFLLRKHGCPADAG